MEISLEYLKSISPLWGCVGGFQIQKFGEHQLVVGGMWSTLERGIKYMYRKEDFYWVSYFYFTEKLFL